MHMSAERKELCGSQRPSDVPGGEGEGQRGPTPELLFPGVSRFMSSPCVSGNNFLHPTPFLEVTCLCLLSL